MTEGFFALSRVGPGFLNTTGWWSCSCESPAPPQNHPQLGDHHCAAPGSFARTGLPVVVAPDAIMPNVFVRFLLTRFNVSACQLEQVNMRKRRMSLGKLYDALS